MGTGSRDNADTPRCSGEIVAGLAAMYHAIQAARLYGPEHPSVRKPVEQLADNLARWQPAGERTVGFGPGTVYVEDAELTEPGELAELADLLHALDLGALRFTSTCSAPSAGTLIRELSAAAGRKESDPHGLIDAIAAGTGHGVEALALSYDSVQLEHTEDQHRNSKPSNDWSRFFERLLYTQTPDDPGGDDAGWIAQAVEANPDAGFRLLHHHVHQSADQLRSLPAGERQEGLQRLRGFLQDLSPRLSAVPTTSAAHHTEEASSTVVDVLRHVNGSAEQVAHASLLMCRQLAELAERFDDAGTPHGSAETHQEFEHALEELLTQHDPQDLTPPDYLAQLEALASGALKCAEIARWTEPFAPAAVRAHAARLAAHLAGSYLDEEGACPEAMHYLASAMPELVSAGRLDLVAEAARNAEVRLSRGGESDSLEAARELMDRVRETALAPGMIERLLAGGQDTRDIVTILRLGGPEALLPALRTLIRDDGQGNRTALHGALQGFDTASLDPLIAELRVADPDAPRKLVRWLGPLSVKRAASWLERALIHRDPATRHAAFEALYEGCPTWPSEFAEPLLNHPDGEVKVLTLRRLLEQNDPDTIALLGRFVEGTVTGRIPGEPTFSRVVDALFEHGDASYGPLAAALQRLSALFHPGRAPYARTLAEKLTAHDADPVVADALRRFNRSPAALLTRYRRGQKGEAA